MGGRRAGKVVSTLTPQATLEGGWRIVAGSLRERRAGEGGASLFWETPGAAVEAFELRVEGIFPAGHGIRVHTGEYVCIAIFGEGGKFQLALAPEIIEARVAPAQSTNGPRSLRLTRREGRWRLEEGETVLIEAVDPLPRQPLAEFEVAIPPGAEVSAITLSTPSLGTASARRAGADDPILKRPALAACIDFYDDLLLSAWTPDHVRSLMRFYRERGIGKVYFVYHYRNESGFWRQPGRDLEFPGFQERIDRSFDALGEVLPAFVREAHAAGLFIYAVFKPFESGFNATFPSGSAEALAHGQIERLGGSLWWCADALVALQRLRVARLPVAGGRAVQLRLTPAHPAALASAISRLALSASSDNGHYLPLCAGEDYRAEIGEGSIIIRFRDAMPPFLVMKMEPGQRRFGNVLARLVRAEGANGEPVEITLGTRPNLPFANWSSDGFGICFGSPKPGQPGSLKDVAWLDNGVPLAVAQGGEPFMAGALSPAYPEARAYWIGLVRECLEAGVDGVDVRVKNHNRAYDSWNYGFEPPVRERFRQETGVDLWADPAFDRAAWRRLRGSFYNAFLEEAAACIHAAGKKLAVHVESHMHSAAWHSEMEIEYDWRGWMEQGWVDQITCKMFRTLAGGIAREAIGRARQRGIRVAVNPSLYAVTPENRLLSRYWHDAIAAGADEFVLYENALFAEPRGAAGIECTRPWIFGQLQGA